jgi:hypothetical protein
MRVINLPKWEAFEKEVASEIGHGTKSPGWRRLLFRGQPYASWKLKTTLERYSSKEFTEDEYYKVVLEVKPATESYTGKRWEFPTVRSQTDSNPIIEHAYEFMVYLRQHGFPSPILDWSLSPYVAAFFAFRPSITMDCNVAIFLYVEFPTGAKFFHPDEPTIMTLKHNVTSHERHFKQQSIYTVCRRQVENQYYFCSHEDVFQKTEDRQDLLIKYVIPGSERRNALEKLHLMNITPYSVFGTEDALMETLAYEEIDQRGRK